MDWTPEEIKKLVKKFGGIAVMAEILRGTPRAIHNTVYGNTNPSIGSGVAIMNLIKILDESMSPAELSTILEKWRTENRSTPPRKKPSINWH